MLNLIIPLEFADGGETHYIPVPCRGVVKSVRISSDINMVANGTLILSRSTTAVNTVTIPTGDKAAGTVTDGVPDATNKDLVFDPDSATAANKVIKVVGDATIQAAAGTIVLCIKYDDTAAVAEASIEA
jgi:hypothetical protein